MIIADTSVWIDHLRSPIDVFAQQLDGQNILMHSLVLGEIAMGILPQRKTLRAELASLPFALIAGDEEVLALVEAYGLFGVGLGFIDAHLLASALITEEAILWTRDRRLAAAATRLGVAG